ncbi:oligo-1,6-glucosidase [Pelobium manganitolerans]|uniref:Oligo-1,6-glucosidase n=1 Tax=Pelobium manganitolerans TaxID=1842495 RepID=A0A419SB72_9SPHI|nr:alpha-glucosidase [Pelobium manganitolerans]RKD20071.1 oligo-1,6-glucosidase [Pelobium manganitolerans]
MKSTWWKESVIYQIYPRSFKDSNGDGIGDLRGIISKLDYVARLGVDAIWLNPIFTSPNDDNGYDISDYRDIMADFGTMADFDELLHQMHLRKLKLILDLVPNHSSDEHFWFQESRKDRDNPYRDYYHWWPAENGKPNHRESYFDVNRDAWAYDQQTNAYYLHYFSKKQPDLNWENPALRKEIYDILRFWFDKGVDGFRMDVVPFISKDTSFPPIPDKYNGNFGDFYAKGPHLHQYLQEMNREVLSQYNCVSIAEGVGVKPEDVELFIDPQRQELDMLYHFEGMSIGYTPDGFKEPDPAGYSLLQFKQVYSKWDKAFEKGWGTIYLGNHDQPRMLSRWGNDNDEFRERSSKLLHTFLLTMRATPFIYYGDELGMSNIKFDDINDYRDIETLNMHQYLLQTGGDVERFMRAQQQTARDNGRTPFQWDNAANAGFSQADPWLKVNPNYVKINAAEQEDDPNSILNYVRQLIQLRKTYPTLIYGDYQLLDPANPQVYSYARSNEDGKFLIALNFSDKDASFNTNVDLASAQVVQGNYPNPQKDHNLRPWEAVIYRLT